MEKKYNLKENTPARKVLRIFGPVVFILGLLFVGVGISDVFRTSQSTPEFGSAGIDMGRFYLAFIGLPLLFVGGVMTSHGYMGSVMRYQASQVAPVGKDVLNYMMDNTSDSVGNMAKSISDGLNGKEKLHCVECGHGVKEDAKFCNECGSSLAKTCPKCQAMSPQKAKFCDECGYDIR